MDLYQVEREGVYRQGMLGVFSSLDAAKAAVEQHIASGTGAKRYTDGDGYHDFTITQVALDVLDVAPRELLWYTARPLTYGEPRTPPYRWESER